MSNETVKVTDIKHLGKYGKKFMNAVLNYKDTFTKARDKYGIKIAQFITGCEIDQIWMRQETAAELIGCDRSYISKLRTAILNAVDKKDCTIVNAHALVEKMGTVKFLDKYIKPRVIALKDGNVTDGESDSDGNKEGESSDNSSGNESGGEDQPELPTTAQFLTASRAFLQALTSGVAVPTADQAETLAIQLMEIVDSIAEQVQVDTVPAEQQAASH